MPSEPASRGPVHYMQTATWAAIKNHAGWKTETIICPDLPVGQIIVYKRLVPSLGNLFYIPGLMGLDTKNCKAATELLKQRMGRKGFTVRLELNEPHDEDLLQSLRDIGWLQSAKHVQYRDTIAVDLTPSKDAIWMSLKSRGRYEVLQAEKFGVRAQAVEPTDENLQKMYELMRETSARNKFFIRDNAFSMKYWQAFRAKGQLRLFFATHEGDLLAGAIVISTGKLAWYKDGGSVRLKANMMAARYLQWEIMRTLKKEGVELYDLGGIPAPEHQQNSSMHGIYVFKSAYSKQTVKLMPTLELPLNSRYKLWPKAEKQWLRVYNLFARNLWW